MDKEYIKRLHTMKPSEFTEEILDVKLFWYQKLYLDIVVKKRAPWYWRPGRRVYVRMLEVIRRILYK